MIRKFFTLFIAATSLLLCIVTTNTHAAATYIPELVVKEYQGALTLGEIPNAMPNIARFLTGPMTATQVTVSVPTSMDPGTISNSLMTSLGGYMPGLVTLMGVFLVLHIAIRLIKGWTSSSVR